MDEDDIKHFLLDVKGNLDLDMDVGDNITSGFLDRTMDGASTVNATVFDPDKVLLKSNLWKYSINVEDSNGKWWRLVNVSKSGRNVSLVFEDGIVAWMRSHKRPLKVSRNKLTRAEFIKKMVDEIKADEHLGMPIEFFSPQLHKKQPIATPEDRKKSSKDKRKNKDGGLTHSLKVKVKGKQATREQLLLMERVFDTVVSLPDSNRKVLEATDMVVTQESGWDPQATNGVHVGLFQQNPAYWPATRKAEPDAAAWGKAVIIADKANPHLSLEDLVETVQHSGQPKEYAKWKAEAKKNIDEYGGGLGGSVSVNYYESYQFTRGQPGGPKDENTWDASKRLAGDVNWYFYVAQPIVYYVSKDDLIGANPVMSNLDEDSDGIEVIDFDWDTNKKINEATITCRADEWFAEQGEVITLNDNMGPAEGRWLVSRINQPYFTDLTTITLRSPLTPKKEPAPTLATSTRELQASPGAISGTPKEIIDKIVLPIARNCGINVTAQDVADANARHGPTNTGSRSDHQGPPTQAWAADMSNGVTTPEEDKLAKELAKRFDIPWDGSGLSEKIHGHYRYQLIYRTQEGGDHNNHVHFGVKLLYFTPDSAKGN